MTSSLEGRVSARNDAVSAATASVIPEIMGAPTATVLFVCDAGTDRAAYLELGLEAELRRRGIVEIEVISAGVSAVDGEGLPQQLADYVGDRGIDASGFSSRRLNVDLIDAADLVLAATDRIRAAVIETQPRASSRTFTVLDVARRIPDVASQIEVVAPAARIRRMATLLDETRDASRRSSDLRGPRSPSHRMPGRRLVAMDDAILALAGVARPLVARRGRHRETRSTRLRRGRATGSRTVDGLTRLA